MRTLSNYPKQIYIGTVDGAKIYLDSPSWDCGWYWGFGCIGNKNCLYHIDGLTKHESYNFDKQMWVYEFTDLRDGFKKHFGKSLIVRDSQLWELCELLKTFYVLKETCEVLGRGGTHYTTNPCQELIKNTSEVERINNIVMPQIFEEIYKILIPSQDNEKINKQLLKEILKGDTKKVVDFMNENKITTDDLKEIDGVTSHDFSVIHSYWWKEYHAKKNELKQAKI